MLLTKLRSSVQRPDYPPWITPIQDLGWQEPVLGYLVKIIKTYANNNPAGGFLKTHHPTLSKVLCAGPTHPDTNATVSKLRALALSSPQAWEAAHAERRIEYIKKRIDYWGWGTQGGEPQYKQQVVAYGKIVDACETKDRTQFDLACSELLGTLPSEEEYQALRRDWERLNRKDGVK